VLANARMLGMSERALMRHVYWPSALSWMFSSLHTAVASPVVGAWSASIYGSAAGSATSSTAEGVFERGGRVRRHARLAAFVIGIDFWSRGRTAASGVAAGCGRNAHIVVSRSVGFPPLVVAL